MQPYNAILLRYVPDAVKNEAVNFGVMLIGQDGFADVRFTRDWARVRCLDPNADIELLSAFEADIRAKLNRSPEDHAAIVKQMQQASNAVQISDPTPCLTASPDDELRRLAELYLERPTRPRTRELAGRQFVKMQMRDAFEDARVWELMMKRIAVAPYTFADDPMKIDCGYKPNGTLRLFHAIALDTHTPLAIRGKELGQWELDLPLGVAPLPFDEHEISFVDAALSQRLVQRDQRCPLFCDQKHPRRIAIKAMHELEKFRVRTAGPQLFDQSECDAAAPVHGKPGRLVDRNDRVVFVKNRK